MAKDRGNILTGLIYIIKNKINNKVYIGQTTHSVEERYKQHMKPSAHKKSYKIYKAINKHGAENFYYEVLENDIPVEQLNEKEIEYIEKFNSYKKGYNSTKGGDGRLINKIEDINYIVNELKNGRFIKDIAEELNICSETISRALHKHGIKNGSLIQENLSTDHLKQINRNDVKALYEQGYKYNEIEKILKIDMRSISRIIKELKLDGRQHYVDYDSLNIEQIKKDKENGMRVRDIIEKYKINQFAYYKIIRNKL